ncbi:BatD family protein [Hyunsoonleella jejuensis]
MNFEVMGEGNLKGLLLSCAFCLMSVLSFAQVTSSIDSTSIKIGEQITYNIQVETDSTNLVVFPEGQTFAPLEMIESYAIDTVKSKDKFSLIKKYGLTQFDSGSYTIPRQKIIVGDNTFFTDSLKVEVNTIAVDTAKQGLYDIKPLIEVKKRGSNWWKYLVVTLLILGIVAALLWWFIWRQKPLSEEEKIALLPPYDRAKLALQKLDESHYLEHEQLKDYYSELTLIIRKYLDEKVYDHALESTTDELISKLRLLKDGNQIDLSTETIKNLESILRRADLVKFAKSAPDVALAELDRNTIDAEIDHVKEVLPEPTEEEKLLDEQYREEQERKKKRKKVWLTVGISVFLLMATIVGFSIKYGFDYVKDTIIGHESKELLEGEWVTSDYGLPPVTISTPKVLSRDTLRTKENNRAKITSFYYGSMLDFFVIDITTYKSKKAISKNDIDLKKAEDEAIEGLEKSGATNIIVKNEKFVTPNGAEGLKTFGTVKLPSVKSNDSEYGEYVALHFAADNILHRISIIWKEDDVYSKQIADRILNSVELQTEEKEE